MICDDLDKNLTNDTINKFECQGIKHALTSNWNFKLNLETRSLNRIFGWTMTKKNNLYTMAHLVAAAIRIHEYRHAVPPTTEDICGILSVSLEEGNRLCHKLSELQIIEALQKPGGTRLFIKDHLKIEDIADQPENVNLQSELDQFKKAREAQMAKIKSIQTEHAEKKKKLHEELEQKLKNIKKY